MERFLWICVAGALGTGARYLVTLGAAKAFGVGFPWGTLIVNVVGCFFISVVLVCSVEKLVIGENVRLALATGFLGGLTTYSAFNFESTELLQNRAWKLFALNVGLTTLGCFVAGLAGLAIARRLFGT